MVLTALARLLPSYEDILIGMGQWKGLVVDIISLLAKEKKDKHLHYGTVREEYWTLEHGDKGRETINIFSSHHDEDVDQTTGKLQLMITLFQQLKLLTTQSIPQLLSRIKYATIPILHEISQGYFVPFHTVAIACLARIHSLLMKLGRELVTVLRETVPQLRDAMKNEIFDFDTSVGKDTVEITKKFTDLVMETLVVGGRYERKLTKKEPSTLHPGLSLPSNEWNNLMENFIDIHQDEITKQMNEYVKDTRWKCAMRKLGLGSSAATTMVLEQRIESDEDISSACDDLPSYNDKVQPQSVREGNKSLDMSCNDMGELVNVHSGQNDDLTAPNNASLEDVLCQNVARIRKEKANHVSHPVGVSESKKKRRKKKTLKSVSFSAFSTCDSDQLLPLRRKNPVDGTNRTNDLICHPDVTVADKLEHVEEVVLTSSKDVTPNEAATSNPKEGKKKKKKRKSTSVIDDIFGF
jgi:hypothetical protein